MPGPRRPTKLCPALARLHCPGSLQMRCARRLMAEHGAGFTVSEMVSSRALVYGDHKTVSLLKAEPNGAPLRRADLWRGARDHGARPRRPLSSTNSISWTSTWAVRPQDRVRRCGQQADAGPGRLRQDRGAGGAKHLPPRHGQDAQGLGCRPHHGRGVRQKPASRRGRCWWLSMPGPRPGADVYPGHRSEIIVQSEKRPSMSRCWATATSTRRKTP